MSYSASFGSFEITVDAEKIVASSRANLQAQVGTFLQNRQVLLDTGSHLDLIASSPDPALKEQVRIAKGNLDLLNIAQDTLEKKSQSMLSTLGKIQDDMDTQSKLTVIERLLTSNVYGTRLPQLAKDALDLGSQIKDQNSKVKQLNKDVMKLEAAARGQGAIPLLKNILSPLGMAFSGLGKGLMIAGGIAGALLLVMYLPKRRSS